MSSGERRRFLLFASATALAMAARGQPSATLPAATDLRADGCLAARRMAPIVVLFSLPGCPYCEIVRRSHLAPLARDPARAATVIIRQIEIDSEEAIVGFSGEKTTPAAIARAHGIRVAPVVAFWDEAGMPIAENLAGMLLPDFYSAYLEAALASAQAQLSRRRRAGGGPGRGRPGCVKSNGRPPQAG